MKFNPKTEEEVMSIGALEGVFDFEIRSAKEYVSDKGNETVELELNVFDGEGIARPRKDWITPAFAKKFKHIHDACGMLDKYQSGSTSGEDFVGKTGKVKMKLRKYTDKEGVEKTGDEVDDYIKRDSSVSKETIATGAIINDEIPFVWILPLVGSALFILNMGNLIYA